MTQSTIGDLAHSAMMRMKSGQLKAELTTLTDELSSGIVADIGRHLGGDLGYYADVESRLMQLDGFDLAARETAQFAESTQTILDRISSVSSSAIARVLPAAASGDQIVRDDAATESRSDIETLVSALNGTSAGRSLFGGTATDRAPLITADTFLPTIQAALPPISDAATLISEVSLWFSDPVGYDSAAYQGATTDLAPVAVADDISVSGSVRADAPEIKAVLEGMVIAALATDPAYGLIAADQTVVFDHASNLLLAAKGGISSLQSNVGVAQERVEVAATRNAASRIGYEQTRSALVGADAFDVATRLDDVQVRLEALYAVTARLSRLSMVNYI
ncbi:MAG: flagellin [Ruegeria sp.]